MTVVKTFTLDNTKFEAKSRSNVNVVVGTKVGEIDDEIVPHKADMWVPLS